MNLFFTLLAEKDLEEIGDYIAIDNPRRAISFIAELRGQCRKICLNPEGYRNRTELSEKIRSCAFGKYVIFFEAEDQQITIIRILHGARDLKEKL